MTMSFSKLLQTHAVSVGQPFIDLLGTVPAHFPNRASAYSFLRFVPKPLFYDLTTGVLLRGGPLCLSMIITRIYTYKILLMIRFRAP